MNVYVAIEGLVVRRVCSLRPYGMQAMTPLSFQLPDRSDALWIRVPAHHS